MSFIATVISILVLGDLAWWWRAHRLLAPLPRRRWWRGALAVFVLAQVAGLGLLFASRMAASPLEAVLARPILASVYLWHLMILVPLLIVWPALDLARGLVALVRRFVLPRREAPVHGGGLSRREFFGAAAAIAPTVLSLGGTAVAMPQLSTFRLRRLEVPLAALPRALDGMTIAHVSDLHVGRFTQGAVLDRVVEATNALRADLVLMTGDLINYSLSDLPVALDLVRKLRGRHGLFMCEGNHDLIEDGAAFVRETRAAGVPLLIGESAQVEVRGVPVQLLGLPWGAPGAASRAEQHGDTAIATSIRGLLAQRDAAAFPILLAHHPHAFDFAGDLPLTLAGHTHGGQLMLAEGTGFGPWMFRYWSGRYSRDGRSLIVSNGVGNWFPLRTHAPAEILHLTLRSTAGA